MAITVPADGAVISASTFGKPVADEVNRMTPITTVTAWTNVTAFQNGWSNFDPQRPAQYRKVGDQVYVRGIIKGGTLAAVAFTLPVGFRPTTGVGNTYGFVVNNNESAGVVNVSINGEIIPQTGVAAAYFYLNSIVFATV